MHSTTEHHGTAKKVTKAKYILYLSLILLSICEASMDAKHGPGTTSTSSSTSTTSTTSGGINVRTTQTASNRGEEIPRWEGRYASQLRQILRQNNRRSYSNSQAPDKQLTPLSIPPLDSMSVLEVQPGSNAEPSTGVHFINTPRGIQLRFQGLLFGHCEPDTVDEINKNRGAQKTPDICLEFYKEDETNKRPTPIIHVSRLKEGQRVILLGTGYHEIFDSHANLNPGAMRPIAGEIGMISAHNTKKRQIDVEYLQLPTGSESLDVPKRYVVRVSYDSHYKCKLLNVFESTWETVHRDFVRK